MDSRWTSDVEMNVWMRQRSAPFSASAARSMSPVAVRASAALTAPRPPPARAPRAHARTRPPTRPRDRRAADAVRDLPDRIELALRRDREPGLEDVDLQPRELL